MGPTHPPVAVLPNRGRGRYAPHMPNSTDAGAGPALVQVAHAIPGRLRLRLLSSEWPSEHLDALSTGLDALRARRGIASVELKRAARAVVIRYEPDLLDEDRVLAFAEAAGFRSAATAADPDGPTGQLSESTEELAALIGIPTSFDRRLVENLALSGVSLLAAGRIGPALGGGMTLPAYFAIWFALRRITGLGRRR